MLRSFTPRFFYTALAGLFAVSVVQAQPVLESVLHQFSNSAEGQNPFGALTFGFDYALYGTTTKGGPGSGGTIFKVTRDGNSFAVLRSFTNNTAEGASPYGGVVQGRDGLLYGTTLFGGTSTLNSGTGISGNGYGVIYKINRDGSAYSVLHVFTNTPDGGNPFSALIQGNDNALYGTTYSGGLSNGGTVFKVNTDGSGFQILHHFAGAPDGSGPVGRLLQASDGMLYGTTLNGGTNLIAPGGAVFRLNPDGSGYSVIYSFTAGDTVGGYFPCAGLTQGSDGKLYGTTAEGDLAGHHYGPGTLYNLNTDGSGYSLLHAFTANPDGYEPYGDLVQGLGNQLYGTTWAGGTNSNSGTVFKVNVGGSGYKVLYMFTTVNDGRQPYSGLVQGPSSDISGVLYGATSIGAAAGATSGAIYSMIVNPPLSITPVTSQTASNQTTVFWPAWALNYTLQSTTNLNSGPWVNVTNGIPVSGVQVTGTNPTVFYRLQSP